MVVIEPADGIIYPPRKQGNVEDVGAIALFVFSQKIEQKRCKSARYQGIADLDIAGAEATGAAAMSKHDDGRCAHWNAECTG